MKKLLATSCVLLATVAAVSVSSTVEAQRLRGRKEAALSQAKATVLAQS
jgi:hypothetical protein